MVIAWCVTTLYVLSQHSRVLMALLRHPLGLVTNNYSMFCVSIHVLDCSNSPPGIQASDNYAKEERGRNGGRGGKEGLGWSALSGSQD